MDREEFCWLAGLVEGEGTIRSFPKDGHRYASIRVKMADEDVVAHVARLFGVGYRPVRDSSALKHHKQQFVTELRYHRAANLLRDLLPLLGQRRRSRAEAVLAELN